MKSLSRLVAVFLFTLPMVVACGGEAGDVMDLPEYQEITGKAEYGPLIPHGDGDWELVNGLVTELRCDIGSTICGVLELSNLTSQPLTLYMGRMNIHNKYVHEYQLSAFPIGHTITIHEVPEYQLFAVTNTTEGIHVFPAIYANKEVPFYHLEFYDAEQQPENTAE